MYPPKCVYNWLAGQDRSFFLAESNVRENCLPKKGYRHPVIPISATLRSSPQAPREARRAIVPLADFLESRAIADVGTVVSELVALSVASGGSAPIRLKLELRGEALHGELADDGAAWRAIQLASGERRSLALRIVDGFADGWGVDTANERVWFRVAGASLA
jgi:hypothetical protein